ncbi:MAG: glycosyltransferase family A protein [Bacteroidales bacterium]
MGNYIIISPVRNEEKFVEQTINSVISQTIKPHEWIIVNDGSTDSTKEIVQRYTAKYPWIKLVNLEDRGYYFPGQE